MPTISAFLGITIAMYWRDHVPPHFHAFYGSEEVLIDIRTLAVLKGGMSRRALELVIESITPTKS